MCGITGMVGFSDRELLKKMCKIISHRGPDDSGMYIDKNVGLGIQRLGIIDVKGGKQPIHNEDESIWIVYNGEIYNFLELRNFLETRGHMFCTNSDTEVIVHLYEEFGDRCVEKLRGMFAFAIWDSNKKMLLLARDRLGIKPLYYVKIDGSLLFGSEIKSILLDSRVKRIVDPCGLYNFLVLRYTPSPLTLFKDVFRLQPANILTWKDGNVEMKKYWKLKVSSTDKSTKYYFDKTYNLLENSVKIRLMSEVPLGAYLSGGIDSSSVVALMAENMHEPVKTFSVGFEDERADELKYARIVADYLNTDHREFIVKHKDYNLLPEVLWNLDEPLADPASIPTYQLSQLAKKYVTVVLIGDGGDEVFGGYEIYKIMKYSKFLNNVPPAIKYITFKTGLKMVPRKIQNLFFNFASSLGDKGLERAVKYFSFAGKEGGRDYLELMGIFDEKEADDLCTNKVKGVDMSNLISQYFRGDSNQLLNNVILFETTVKLPDDYLIKKDKMTMAYSIEARVPLLDHKLVEFAATIPQNLKVRYLKDKYIFRKLMSKKLPKEIVWRSKQRWFVPIDKWFEGELVDIFNQLYSEDNVKKLGYFKYDYIRKIVDSFSTSKLYAARQMWSLLTFEIWRRVFIEGNFTRKPKSLEKLI